MPKPAWREVIDVRVILLVSVLVVLVFNVAVLAKVKSNSPADASFSKLDVVLLTTPDCSDCFDLQPFRDYLTENGVEEKQIVEQPYTSSKGKKLVKKYAIESAPTVIISGDVASYDFMTGLIENVGEIRGDAFVMTRLQPPYIDIATKAKHGEFELITLVDATCTECYDPALHASIFERMAMKPNKTSTVDIASEEGKLLVEEYVITAVPTILLRGDLMPYDQLQEVWPLAGTVEEDGTYILRQGVSSMGAYISLPEGTVVKTGVEDTTTN